MTRCPVCGSRQVVTVVLPRRYVCGECAATWVLELGDTRMLWHPSMPWFSPPDEPRPRRPHGRGLRLHRAS
ncbi:MAG TPA: hypothetical protein VE669_11785 [Actinomycetota bacterium]|nr:hypothetical protein [Actinomycetota bacterium]